MGKAGRGRQEVSGTKISILWMSYLDKSCIKINHLYLSNNIHLLYIPPFQQTNFLTFLYINSRNLSAWQRGKQRRAEKFEAIHTILDTGAIDLLSS